MAVGAAGPLPGSCRRASPSEVDRIVILFPDPGLPVAAPLAAGARFMKLEYDPENPAFLFGKPPKSVIRASSTEFPFGKVVRKAETFAADLDAEGRTARLQAAG